MLSFDEQIDNIGELRNFVFNNDLMDRASNIRFKALVTINTANRVVTDEEVQVAIYLDNDGVVDIITERLDTRKFPLHFSSVWQKMFNKNKYLFIVGKHERNNAIGNYEIKLVPLNT